MQDAWFNTSSYWRDSGRYLKFGPFDARSFLLLLVWFLYPSWMLFYIAIGAIFIGYGLNYIGYTLSNMLRKIMTMIAGNRKAGVHYWRRHKFK